MASDYRPPITAGTQAAIDAEASTRASADTALAGTVTAEAVARANADSAEATARANAITAAITGLALSSDLSAETTARIAADTTLTTAVGLKASSAALASETSSRASADTALDGRLTTVESNSADLAASSGTTIGLTAGDPAVLDFETRWGINDAGVVTDYGDVGLVPEGEKAILTIGEDGQFVVVRPGAPNDPAELGQRIPVDGSVTAVKIAAALKPSGSAVAATEALRALGASAGQALPGDDARLSEGLAGSQTVRSLGTGSTQALPGDHASTTNMRTPTDGSVTFPKLDVSAYPARMPTTGEEVVDRALAVGSSPMSNQAVRVTYFFARRTETITKVLLTTAATPAAATPTLVRAGVYAVNTSDWSLTALLAAIANDTTIFAAANTEYLRSLTSSFAKVAGIWYAFAQLVVTGATAPQVPACLLQGTVMGGSTQGRPRLAVSITGQADLPAGPVAVGSLAASSSMCYGLLVP